METTTLCVSFDFGGGGFFFLFFFFPTAVSGLEIIMGGNGNNNMISIQSQVKSSLSIVCKTRSII